MSCSTIVATFSLLCGAVIFLTAYSDVLFAIHNVIPLDLMLAVLFVFGSQSLQKKAPLPAPWNERLAISCLWLLQPLLHLSLSSRDIAAALWLDMGLALFWALSLSWRLNHSTVESPAALESHILLVFYGAQIAVMHMLTKLTFEPFWWFFSVALAFLGVAFLLELLFQQKYLVQIQFALIQLYAVGRSCFCPSSELGSGQLIFVVILAGCIHYVKTNRSSWLLKQLWVTITVYFFVRLISSDYSYATSGFLMMLFGVMGFLTKDHQLRIFGVQGE